MPTPSALYIGPWAEDKAKSELTAVAATKGMPIFKMRLSSTEFKLTFDPVT
jgi:hypothetical protein